jgi:hypothetical protein
VTGGLVLLAGMLADTTQGVVIRSTIVASR